MSEVSREFKIRLKTEYAKQILFYKEKFKDGLDADTLNKEIHSWDQHFSWAVDAGNDLQRNLSYLVRSHLAALVELNYGITHPEYVDPSYTIKREIDRNALYEWAEAYLNNDDA